MEENPYLIKREECIDILAAIKNNEHEVDLNSKMIGQCQSLSQIFLIYQKIDSKLKFVLIKIDLEFMDVINVKEIILNPKINLGEGITFKIISDNNDENKLYLQSRLLGSLISLVWEYQESSLNGITIKEEENNYPRYRILDAMFSKDGKYYYELKEGLGLIVFKTENNEIQHIYNEIRVKNQQTWLKEVIDKRHNRILLV